MAKVTEEQKKEAFKALRKMLKPGDTVYTILRSVSASGMTRILDLYAIKGNVPCYLTGYACNLLGYARTNEGLKVQGCGSDAGNDVVHSLGYAVYPEGFKCIGEKGSKRCPHNSHSNTPHPKRDGKMFHEKSGYVFRQEWI
jgi:hypothetical protein